MLVWSLQEDPECDSALLPVPIHRNQVEDRVWCVSTSSTHLLFVGTAGTRGICPLRLYDVATGAHVLDMGMELDIAWISGSTFLACGYDTFTRLWESWELCQLLG